mmetsp:Transcript_69688/g.151656  ORF Transcript_69688/g.151656 Transcript_69688/m.151656 type:complete len:103 (-) Transcript_69688:37-345(-)
MGEHAGIPLIARASGTESPTRPRAPKVRSIIHMLLSVSVSTTRPPPATPSQMESTELCLEKASIQTVVEFESGIIMFGKRFPHDGNQELEICRKGGSEKRKY